MFRQISINMFFAKFGLCVKTICCLYDQLFIRHIVGNYRSSIARLVTEFIVLENECLWLQLTNLVLFERVSKIDNVTLQQIVNGIPLLKYWYLGFPSTDGPTLPNEISAIIITQPSSLQGEHWIMIANCRHRFYFADSLGCEKYSFLKQHFKQIMPKPLQTHPRVLRFLHVNAAFHIFKFRQEEVTGVQDVKVFSFTSNYMQYFIVSNVNVLVLQPFC